MGNNEKGMRADVLKNEDFEVRMYAREALKKKVGRTDALNAIEK